MSEDRAPYEPRDVLEIDVGMDEDRCSDCLGVDEVEALIAKIRRRMHQPCRPLRSRPISLTWTHDRIQLHTPNMVTTLTYSEARQLRGDLTRLIGPEPGAMPPEAGEEP